MEIAIVFLQFGHDGPRAIGRLAVDHDDLEPIRVVVLVQYLQKRSLNVRGFVADRNDDGDKWPDYEE
jgi:hypothetical protein